MRPNKSHNWQVAATTERLKLRRREPRLPSGTTRASSLHPVTCNNKERGCLAETEIALDTSPPRDQPRFPSRDDLNDGLALVLEQKAQSEVELASLEGPLFP